MHAEIEEWDDTTDVIMWIIEQDPTYHLSCARLDLEVNPEQRYGRSSFETLDNQVAYLSGWTDKHEKVRFKFDAEVISIANPTAEDPDAEDDGYAIEIMIDNIDYRMKPFAYF